MTDLSEGIESPNVQRLFEQAEEKKDVAVVTILLSNGNTITETLGDDVPADLDAEEIAAGLLTGLLELERPQFIRFGTTVVHTQGIAALVVDLH